MDKTLRKKNGAVNQGAIFETKVTTSAMDCTGLIPSLVTSDSEAESYEDLYPINLPGGKEKV